jgi:hypothetical protein
MSEINYSKSIKIDLGKIEKQFEKFEKENEKEKEKSEIKYNPFEITQLQNYNPIYSLFFEMNENTYNCISLNHSKHFVDLNTIFDETLQKKKTNVPIHIKYAPLLDPIHYLIGKYEKDRSRLLNLPKFTLIENNNILLPKITSIYNTAYTDCFFSYLSSKLLNNYEFKNGIDFYGSFLGIQKKFKMDITDDYEYLLESDFFHSQYTKLYEIEPALLNQSNPNQPKLLFGDEISLEVDILENEISLEVDILETELELIYENKDKTDDDLCEKRSSRKNTDDDDDTDNFSFISNSSEDDKEEDEEEDEEERDDKEKREEKDEKEKEKDEKEEEKEEEEEEEEEWSDIDDDNTDEEPQVFAYIHDFPVQMICLEKCENTFDFLLENEMLNEKQIIGALFQIIMTLITYQKAYYFTHNDLHTNNIVYTPTKHEWIEYEYMNKKYKVPTYGRIFKIIDFGRSIYRFQDKLFCSDSFAPGGDAHTQYNTEPFLNTNKPRLETNFSFDLSRLGCSLYDYFDYFGEDDEDHYSKLQELITKWCTDDNGKNILYKKTGEERYPNFKLYKMIARTVHGCIPSEQLKNPIFDIFSRKTSKTDKNDKTNKTIFISIDKIPKLYV